MWAGRLSEPPLTKSWIRPGAARAAVQLLYLHNVPSQEKCVILGCH